MFKSSGTSRFSVRWRQLIHKPLVAIFKLTLKHKVRLLRNDSKASGKPVIYAATHVFYDDAAAVISSLNKSAHLLIGIEGPNNTPKIFERIALAMNGVIVVNRKNKSSRKESAEKLINALKTGGDVLIFPEGAWNFSPNLPLQKLNWGAINIARIADVDIVPVAVDLVNNSYFVIIGESFEASSYTNDNDAVNGLRDAIATLAWELICMKPVVKRQDLPDTFWLDHIKAQYARIPTKDQQIEESIVYRPKGGISLGELLADMHGIEYKSMAVDYEQHRRIMKLCDDWSKPVRFDSASEL